MPRRDVGKPAAMTVLLVGPLRVRCAGSVRVGAQISSIKGRRLLALLAVRRSATVTVDEIVEQLWSKRRPGRPEGSIATLVSRLRARFGPTVVVHTRAGYRLGDPPAVRVDLDEAARLVNEARHRLECQEPALATAAATRAMELLSGGPVLADEPDAMWVVSARSEGVALLRSAHLTAATAALRTGDAAAARAAAEAAVSADGLDEPASRLLMRAYQAGGEPGRALAVYSELQRALSTELGVDPAPETRAVHLAVLREGAPPSEAVSGALSPPVQSSISLVGRDAEVAQLAAAWSAAAAGEPTLVLLVGEAGIGKTCLAAHTIATAENTGGTVLQARCYAAERSLFLQPLIDAITPLVTGQPPGALATLAGARAATLVGLIPEAGGLVDCEPDPARGTPDIERRRAYDAVTTVLRGVAAHQAVLLLLDDLHNAGLATVGFLHYLTRHAAGARLLVLATLRTEEGEAAITALAEVAQRIDLGPLPAPAVALLAQQAGHAELAEDILRRTRGHTLFVVETLQGLTAGEVGIPASLQAAVLARTRRAGPEVEALLRAGAVLGATVNPALIAGLLDLHPAAALQRCAQAATARLLVVAGRDYEFANDLVHEVLYASTPAPARLTYHHRAADLLTDHPEAVARHATAVEDWSRAARAYLIAGEHAAQRFATADAGALLDHAVRTATKSGQPELLARATLARGRIRETRASFDAALADQRAALTTARQAGDRRLEMLALRELAGDVSVAIGLPITETGANLAAGLRIAQSLGDRGMQADVLARLAIISSNRLLFTEALNYGHRATTAGHAASDDRALAAGLDGLRNAYAYLGELTPLTSVIDELEPLLRRLGDLWRLQWTVFESAFPSIATGDWDAADRRINEALELNRRSGFTAYEACFMAHQGWIARLAGRYDTALTHGRRAVALATQAPHGWYRLTADTQLATTLHELGQTAAATSLLLASRPDPGGAEVYRLRRLAQLAEATADKSVLAQADGLLRAISAPAGCAWLLGTDTYLAIARAWLTHRDPARARAVLAPLLDAAARQRWAPALAAGWLVDGQAATALHDPAAHDILTQAAEIAARHHLPAIEAAARGAARNTSPSPHPPS